MKNFLLEKNEEMVIAASKRGAYLLTFPGRDKSPEATLKTLATQSNGL